MDGQATRCRRECDGIGTSARTFIAWNQESAFVSDLEEVERGVAVLTDSDPVRAAYLYEAFIAACYLKADEIHAEWKLGNVVGEPASGWIRAR